MKQDITVTCQCGRELEVSHLAPKFVSEACPACVIRFGPGDFSENIEVKSKLNPLIIITIVVAYFGLWELIK